MNTRLFAAIAAAGLLATVATACQDTTTGAGSGGATTKASAKHKGLNGNDLRAMLLTEGLPTGLKLDPSGSKDTGADLRPEEATPLSAAELCPALDATSWVRTAAVTPKAFAQNQYADAAQTEQYAQELDAFGAGDGKKVMAGLSAAFAQCKTYTDTSQGGPAKVRVTSSRLPGVGDEALKAVITSSNWDGGTTLVAVRVGDAVVTVLHSSPKNDKGADAARYAGQLAHKLQSA